MLPEHYEEIKKLIDEIADSYGEPDETQVEEMNRLTGGSWTADGLREYCCDYWSGPFSNSLDATAYAMYHDGEYPKLEEIELVFWKLKQGVNMEPKTLYEKLRYVKTCAKVKAVEILPIEEIISLLEEQFLGWGRKEGQELPAFQKVQPEEPWNVQEVSLYDYENKMLSVTCTNLSEGDRKAVVQLMEQFGCTVYRPEQ